MAVNDTVQLSVIGTVSTQQHVHTLNFRALDPTSTEQALIDRWQAGCRTAYLAQFRSFNNAVERYVARQVCGTVPLRAPTEEVEVDPNRAGTKATTGDDMPPWLASIMSVRSALAGRSRRGRFFIGGISEDEQERGNLSAPAIARYQAYVDALMTEFGPTGVNNFWRLVIHSRKLAGVSPAPQCQDSSTIVNGIIVRPTIGSQKSRKAGSGV